MQLRLFEETIVTSLLFRINKRRNAMFSAGKMKGRSK
jgi:hypothetical protein